MVAQTARVVKHTAFMSSASRQLLLRATSWRPEKPEQACLVVAHHIGDHGGNIERYAGVLAASGIAVVSADCQGWGESESYRQFQSGAVGVNTNYYIKSEDQLVADFDKLVSRVMQFYTVKGADPRFPLSKILHEKLNPWDPEPPIASQVPIFVMGHGMGAPVVARYLADRVACDRHKQAAVKGAILAAPWIGHCPELSSAEALSSTLSEFFCRYMPHTKQGTSEPDPSLMFEDVEEVLNWERDSVIAKSYIPHPTCRIISKISKQAKEILPSITTPALVMTGTNDPLCPHEVGEEVLSQLGSEEKEIISIPDSKHDLFKSSALTGHMATEYLLQWIHEKRESFEDAEDPMAEMDDDKRKVCSALQTQ